MLSYEDAAAAADFAARAFGFEELERFADADGRVTHVTLRAGDGLVMFGWPEVPFVVDGVLVYVGGLDAHHAAAAAAGARILSTVEENEAVGQRQYRAEDLEGHRWMFAERLRRDG